jgi:uncharacterized protein YcfJ
MPLSGMPWMYGQGAQSPQRQRFQAADIPAGPSGVAQVLGTQEMIDLAARRRDEEQRARLEEELRKQQRQAKRAAEGKAAGAAVGGLVGSATAFAHPGIAAVATPVLGLAGGAIGETLAGGKPTFTATDAAALARGAISGGRISQEQQRQDKLNQLRIDSVEREAAFMQNLHPSLLEAYANAPDRIIGQVQAGDYAEFNDRFVPYWERRGA